MSASMLPPLIRSCPPAAPNAKDRFKRGVRFSFDAADPGREPAGDSTYIPPFRSYEPTNVSSGPYRMRSMPVPAAGRDDSIAGGLTLQRAQSEGPITPGDTAMLLLRLLSSGNLLQPQMQAPSPLHIIRIDQLFMCSIGYASQTQARKPSCLDVNLRHVHRNVVHARTCAGHASCTWHADMAKRRNQPSGLYLPQACSCTAGKISRPEQPQLIIAGAGLCSADDASNVISRIPSLSLIRSISSFRYSSARCQLDLRLLTATASCCPCYMFRQACCPAWRDSVKGLTRNSLSSSLHDGTCTLGHVSYVVQ